MSRKKPLSDNFGYDETSTIRISTSSFESLASEVHPVETKITSQQQQKTQPIPIPLPDLPPIEQTQNETHSPKQRPYSYQMHSRRLQRPGDTWDPYSLPPERGQWTKMRKKNAYAEAMEDTKHTQEVEAHQQYESEHDVDENIASCEDNSEIDERHLQRGFEYERDGRLRNIDYEYDNDQFDPGLHSDSHDLAYNTNARYNMLDEMNVYSGSRPVDVEEEPHLVRNTQSLDRSRTTPIRRYSKQKTHSVDSIYRDPQGILPTPFEDQAGYKYNHISLHNKRKRATSASYILHPGCTYREVTPTRKQVHSCAVPSTFDMNKGTVFDREMHDNVETSPTRAGLSQSVPGHIYGADYPYMTQFDQSTTKYELPGSPTSLAGSRSSHGDNDPHETPRSLDDAMGYDDNINSERFTGPYTKPRSAREMDDANSRRPSSSYDFPNAHQHPDNRRPRLTNEPDNQSNRQNTLGTLRMFSDFDASHPKFGLRHSLSHGDLRSSASVQHFDGKSDHSKVWWRRSTDFANEPMPINNNTAEQPHFPNLAEITEESRETSIKKGRISEASSGSSKHVNSMKPRKASGFYRISGRMATCQVIWMTILFVTLIALLTVLFLFLKAQNAEDARKLAAPCDARSDEQSLLQQKLKAKMEKVAVMVEKEKRKQAQKAYKAEKKALKAIPPQARWSEIQEIPFDVAPKIVKDVACCKPEDLTQETSSVDVVSPQIHYPDQDESPATLAAPTPLLQSTPDKSSEKVPTKSPRVSLSQRLKRAWRNQAFNIDKRVLDSAMAAVALGIALVINNKLQL